MKTCFLYIILATTASLILQSVKGQSTDLDEQVQRKLDLFSLEFRPFIFRDHGSKINGGKGGKGKGLKGSKFGTSGKGRKGSKSEAPSDAPSLLPSVDPSTLPSSVPSTSFAPTESSAPSSAPTVSLAPTVSGMPSLLPSDGPSMQPSGAPSLTPSVPPSYLERSNDILRGHKGKAWKQRRRRRWDSRVKGSKKANNGFVRY